MLTGGDSKAWFSVLPVCVMLKHSLPYSPKFSSSWYCQSTTTFKEERRLSCRGMFLLNYLILKAEASHGTSGAPAFSLSLDPESRSASLPTWQAALLLEHSPCPPFLCLFPALPMEWWWAVCSCNAAQPCSGDGQDVFLRYPEQKSECNLQCLM